MGCVKSKVRTEDKTNEPITENTNDYEAQNGEGSVLKFVNFQDPPEQVREFSGFPDLRLDMNLIQSSRHNLAIEFPLTPSFRRVKQERTLIKRHSAPEPKRGAFPSALKLKLMNQGNLYQHPETTRQQQLSSVLKSIDNILEIPELTSEIVDLLNSLRRALFNSNVDANLAKQLLDAIKQCNNLAPKQLLIDLSKPNEVINTQYSLTQTQNELTVILELIRCVPKFVKSLRLAHFQISSEFLTELAYSVSCCRCLTKLSLKACSLNDAFIEVFTKELGKGNSLLELDISSNFIRDSGLTTLGLFLLSEKSILTFLDISQNFFTKEAIEVFDILLLSSINWGLRLLSDSRIQDRSIEQAFKNLYRKQFNKRSMFHDFRVLTTKATENTVPLINKVCDHNYSVTFEPNAAAGFHLTKGHRVAMEDFLLFSPSFKENSSLFGIFDGHGGLETARVSSFLLQELFRNDLEVALDEHEAKIEQTQHSGETEKIDPNQILVETALKASFQQTQKFLERCQIPHGSCALVVYIEDNVIYTANAGDSQGILVEFDLKNTKSKPKYQPLGLIKRPTDVEEQKRIEDANGLVLRGRVDGTIAVSRALGDLEYQPKITFHPLLTRHSVDKSKNAKEKKLIVLGSDGLWDILSYEKVSEYCCEFMSLSEQSRDNILWQLSRKLVELALKNGSSDNISVICVQL